MTELTQEQTLHDRATCGETLTAEEQTALKIWYARQDAEESALLNANVSSSSTGALREQISMALAELRAVTEHVQTLTTENEAIRREIAVL